jgi:hypothetical protein
MFMNVQTTDARITPPEKIFKEVASIRSAGKPANGYLYKKTAD